MGTVMATPGDDSVTITFDPVDGALDYRVYPLPSDDDIDVREDGQVVIRKAIYRCAGNREAAAPFLDDDPAPPSSAMNTRVDDVDVAGYQRSLADATLGHVYTQPGPGRLPVFALGESDPNADSRCFFTRWAASRAKRYTTSEAERDDLLRDFARDDGIAFYVPAGDGGAVPIYLDLDEGTGNRTYFPAGPEADAHPNKVRAFSILAEPAEGTQPLMRVYYQNLCGMSHDELAVGRERFNRIYRQGDQLPWWTLRWSGITERTTLVVEALDRGCPFQGHLSPVSLPDMITSDGANPAFHPPYVTIDEVRAYSPDTEVFVNGQHGPAWRWSGVGENGTVERTEPSAADLAANRGVDLPRPRAIARSFVDVAPEPRPGMDFLATFSPGDSAERFDALDCGAPSGNCYGTFRHRSPTFDRTFLNAEFDAEGDPLIAYGPVMGELWVGYANTATQANGEFRLTAREKARIAASDYLHVTMEVDAYSTSRRFPQIVVSDQDPPLLYNLQNGRALVVQTIAGAGSGGPWPLRYELQVCELREWRGDFQCPAYDFSVLQDGAGNVTHLAPNAEVGESASVDHRVRFDVFVSSARAYLFLEGKPYGCADLPTSSVPTGEVSVTWGDILYHSSVDGTFAFHRDHMQIDQRRIYDNLGFSSGVAAPAWDHARLPCQPPIML
jgi:hypothetical protein